MNSKLFKVPINNSSGFYLTKPGLIAPLRQGYYYVEDIMISGDAPKDFVRVYEYGKSRKALKNTWIPYIAKVGHKWYPVESITEYLMNRIGEVLGLDMAPSKLMFADEQVRFLSRYFLNRDAQLVHGAQVYASFLEDEKFVEKVEAESMSQDFFTFQFTQKAVQKMFGLHSDRIMDDFCKMILFDAIVGNNDRHFYNWGVVMDLRGSVDPCFSPIYDTARGLFWNYSEERLKALFIDNQGLLKYIRKSKPKIGWEGKQNLNHFELVKSIHALDGKYCIMCEKMLNYKNISRIATLIDQEFRLLLSVRRRNLIKVCLENRFEQLNLFLNSK